MGLKRIPLDQITPNPDQPRKHFDEAALRELAASIHARGLKQPIAVRPIGDGRYEIIMGERRWRAHRLLRDEGKLEDATILTHVRKASDGEMAIDSIIENLARADLTVLEEANAFQRMIDAGYSVERLARELGIQAHRIRYRLQLMALDPSLQDMLSRAQISAPVAHEIGRLPNPHRPTPRGLPGRQGLSAQRNAGEGRSRGHQEGRGAAGLLGDLPPAPTAEELATVSDMESRIDRVLPLWRLVGRMASA